MGEAELPVVYPTALGRELAPLFGHREELAVTAERDSLLVLPEDRRLPIRIQYGDEIKTLQYEIRTMDRTHLVERTICLLYTSYIFFFPSQVVSPMMISEKYVYGHFSVTAKP